MKYALVIILFLTLGLANGQVMSQAQWQQKVDYDIDVSINDTLNTLKGKELIKYHNNSPDTIKEIYIHLWANAYRNNRTPFAQQQLRVGDTKFYYAAEKDRGGIDASFSINGINQNYTNPEKGDSEIVILTLAKPIIPGASIEIESQFKVKIPKEFSRMGNGRSWFGGKDYQITQWFPKVAMYDVNGWHPFNYLDLGEFYDNFGDYEVSITVPSQYVVAATGVLQENEKEEKWLTKLEENFSRDRKIEAHKRHSTGKTKTLIFEQKNVHDFAWFASDNFIRRKDEVTLGSGKKVETYYYGIFDNKMAMEALKDALKFYSIKLGDYPYDACSVVNGALSAGGGMEYPMITVISQMTERVIVHEVGHNWFQGILGTNERRYPWMDEGVNSFFENQYFKIKDKNNSRIKNRGSKLLEYTEYDESYFVCRHQHNLNESQVPGLHSDDYTELNYGGIVYGKVALMFEYLKTDLGDSLFNTSMQNYYEQWKFKHPLPSDMKRSFERTSGKNLSWFFEDAMNNNREVEIRSTGPVLLPHGENIPKLKKKLKITLMSIMENPKNRYLYLLPALGWNEHNKLMFGFTAFNEMVQAKKTSFNITPMYSGEDKNINGFANIETRIPLRGGKLYRTDLGIKTQAFDYTVLEDALHYTRIKPYVAFNFRESNRQKYGKVNRLELAGYYIHSSGDSANKFAINKRAHVTSTYVYNNNKAINNTKFKAVLEYGIDGVGMDVAGEDFSKISLTWKQDLNYKKRGQKLKLRVFAGKFIKSPTNNLSGIYHFRLSQNTGIADYLMDDLVLFRSPGTKTDFQARQLTENGGAMRNPVITVIPDQDKWIFALNVESTLPGKIPLRPFFDIGLGKGTQSAPGFLRKNILFVGGLSLVIAEDIFEIYFPLMASQQFLDRYEFSDIDFHQRISFKLNLPLLNPLEMIKL